MSEIEYSVKSGRAAKQRVACVIVGVFDRRKPSESASQLNEEMDGAIARVMRRGDMDGRIGQTLLLHTPESMLCDRVLLVGCGRERDIDDRNYRRITESASRALTATGAIDATSYLTEIPVRGRDVAWRVRQSVLAFEMQRYRFDECRGSQTDNGSSDTKLARMTFNVPRRSDLPDGEQARAEALAIAAGATTARRLGDLPGNICTPTYLAEQGAELAQRFSGVKARILDEKDMESLGMGALLAVSRGSRQPPRLLVLEFMNGQSGDKPVVLVGKGLTFDAGGISIKPSAKMDEMKYDMCGGASVIGSIEAAARLDLPLNVVGVVPCSENLPDGDANKPGDILTSLSGITIEVLNTDAEGRLILCDALTWVERNYEPAAVVDIATLTGACVVALGHHAAGLYSNNDALARRLLAAGESINDRAWQMPLWPEYDQQLKSPFADVANIGGPAGGSITAACFLHRFAKKMRWAHLDIAGVAWRGGEGKGSTGRPVPLLSQFLIDEAHRRESD